MHDQEYTDLQFTPLNILNGTPEGRLGIDSSAILIPDQYNIIFKLSFISGFTAGYAFYNNYIDIAIINGIVFLTSINYWRKPDYSWRRYLDMTMVKSAIIYEGIRAYTAEYSNTYYILILAAIIWYYFGVYCYTKKSFWLSTYSHCMLHILGNIAKIILYSGYISPITNIR